MHTILLHKDEMSGILIGLVWNRKSNTSKHEKENGGPTWQREKTNVMKTA